MQNHTALLFVNGEPPKHYPKTSDNYCCIAATDGAYHNYLSSTSIIPDYIIGDLDSFNGDKNTPNTTQVIHTPDQNKTDFEKAMLFLANKGMKRFIVYGACGHASDHFLGNLSVAKQYHQQFDIIFYDNFCHFFFAQHQQVLTGIKNRIISLMPFPKVINLSIEGVQYPLTNATLKLGELTSLRNKAISDLVKISFKNGTLLIFIEDLHTDD